MTKFSLLSFSWFFCIIHVCVYINICMYTYMLYWLNCIWLVGTPWTAAGQTPLSLTISRSLSKFMSFASVMPPSHLIFWHPLLLCPQFFPASGTFPISWLFTSDDQNTGVSASFLPMSSQGWFPLRLTGLVSLLSKGLSEVFSSITSLRIYVHIYNYLVI